MGFIAAPTGAGSSIAHAASKGTLVTMPLSLARVLGPYIRDKAVCPGFIVGKWLRKGLGNTVYDKMKAHYESIAYPGKTAAPETVAETVTALVSGMD